METKENMNVEENNATDVSEQKSLDSNETKKKSILKWGLIAAAVIVAGIVISIVVYVNSPSYRAMKQVELGEKYLQEMNYEQAVLCFEQAIKIDPNNKEVLEIVAAHLDELYEVARSYGVAQEYASEKTVAQLMLLSDADSVKGAIADAEADCGMEEWAKAKETLEKVKDSEIEKEYVIKTIKYCEMRLLFAEYLQLGEKYLQEKDYEQAIKYFVMAMELDPDNKELLEIVSKYLEEFYQAARKYGATEEYASEKAIAQMILKIDTDSVKGAIADAEADCGMGDFERAKGTLEKVRNTKVDDEFVEKTIQYCDIALQLIAYCEGNNWEQIAEYLNTGILESVSDKFEAEKKIVYTKKLNMIVDNTDAGYYVYCGDVNEKNAEGNGTAVVTAVNTNSIYTGEWKGNKPDGNGELRIWNKNESSILASVFKGKFIEGVLDGTVELIKNGTFEIKCTQGDVSVYKTDAKGNVWISEQITDNGFAYIAEYEKENNGVIDNYIAGVPELGGSDRTLSIGLLDVQAPVIKCNRKLNEGEFIDDDEVVRNDDWDIVAIFDRISATDNADGNLTEKISYTSKKIPNSQNGRQDDYDYGLIVTYSVTDRAGNVGTLKVTYDLEWPCGIWATVIAIE